MKKFMLFMLFVLLLAPCAMSQEVREYTVNKVSETAPVIDGEFTEEEWAGSVFTGEFYGLEHGDNAAEWAGKVVEEKWQWRALWDNDYLYVLITAELQYINMNGWVYSGDMVTPLEADDTGYASWGAGSNLDFECFISPNWDDDMTGYPNEVGGNPPAYQMCYFPLLADEENGQLYADSNFGSRTTADEPPFFNTSTLGVANIGGWNPIYDASEADTADVKPFKLAALPHLVEGAVAGEGIFGIPVMEVAFPFSQFSFPALPDVTVIEDVDILLENLIMIPDENGVWVEPGDIWLFNVCGYVDGAVHEQKALSYISWNEMGSGGFHNAPRGKMIFAAGTSVTEWMMH